jgi:hypothetical protein
MGDPQSLYDKLTLRFKNNKWSVFILIAFAVVLGIAQVLGAWSNIKDALFPAKTHVHVSAATDLEVSRGDRARAPFPTVQGWQRPKPEHMVAPILSN